MSETRDKPAIRAGRLGRRRVCTPVRSAIILGALGLVCLIGLAGQGSLVSAQGVASVSPLLQEPTLPPRSTPPPPPPPRPTPPPPPPPRPSPPPPTSARPTSGPEEPHGPHEPQPTAQSTPMFLPTSGSMRSPELGPVLIVGLGMLAVGAHLVWRRHTQQR